MESKDRESNLTNEFEKFQPILEKTLGEPNAMGFTSQMETDSEQAVEGIEPLPNFNEVLAKITSSRQQESASHSSNETNVVDLEQAQNQSLNASEKKQLSESGVAPQTPNVAKNLSEEEETVPTPTNPESSETTQASDRTDNPFNQLRSLLVSEPLDDLDDKIAQINQKIANVEQRIDRDYLSTDRLLALFAEVIDFRVSESREILKTAMDPIIQTAIREKITQNKQELSQAMIQVMTDVTPEAIRQSSEDIAMAIAPNIAIAIQQQIAINKTAMVETLAPIIDRVIQQNITQSKHPDLQNILTSAVMPEALQKLKEVRQELIEISMPSQIEAAIEQKNFIDRHSLESRLIPMLDRLIQKRTQQDKASMVEAFAPIIAPAIAKQTIDSPDEIAKALSPEIATTIKEKIKQDRLAMVDALYPVIGNTIIQYIAETIREINQKLERTLTPQAIQRKIRAKIQGVSEAELLLQEASSYHTKGLFLIHNQSGLVISEVQQEGKHRIESDMVAGMLTAIRSFVSEYMLDSTQNSEVQKIDYGKAQILIEVAGYCYLAVVIEGDPSKAFIQQIRQTLAKIIEDYGKQIASFKGKSSTIPKEVHQLLKGLASDRSKTHKHNPPILLILALGLLGSIAIPWAMISYRQFISRQLIATTTDALFSAPELSIYRLNVDVNGGTMTLTGRVPNQFLRDRAQQIATSVTPTMELDNQIIVVDVPPDPVQTSAQTSAEVKRVQDILNRIDRISIVAVYESDRVTVTGTILQKSDAELVTKAFAQIPGVNTVVNTSEIEPEIEPLTIETRIYFSKNSAKLNSADITEKIEPIEQLMSQSPDIQLKIVGHGDPRSDSNPDKWALQRANVVKAALERQGIAPERLQAIAYAHPPSDVDPLQPLWLSRCVVFYPIASGINSQ